MDKAKEVWDRIYKNAGSELPPTDGWLDKYMPLIEQSREVPIIDLGCGFGNDTLYLKWKGFSVVSCDYSKTALERLKHFVERPDCRCLDMREKLPFDTASANIIICDLSLHYFSEKITRAIIAEINRVLKKRGSALCRVNSLDEIANEENKMTVIEKHFYLVGQKKKRYFNKESVYDFFGGFQIGRIYEYEMLRYKNPKCVLDFAAQK